MLLTELEQAAEGLLYMSESDYPLTPYRWPEAEPFSEAALLSRYPADTPLETVTVAYFFRNAVVSYEGANEEDISTAERFRGLVALLETRLTDAKVYRVGRISIDVYILGRDEAGEVVGLRTVAIET